MKFILVLISFAALAVGKPTHYVQLPLGYHNNQHQNEALFHYYYVHPLAQPSPVFTPQIIFIVHKNPTTGEETTEPAVAANIEEQPVSEISELPPSDDEVKVETPEKTEEAEKTPDKTEDEPAADEIPEKSEEPVVDDAPVKSVEPAAVETPEKSEEPVVDDTPKKSEEPAADDTPVKSEDPVVDEAPEKSEEPVVVHDTPVKSEEPAAVEIPEKAPAEVPVETPEKSVDPVEIPEKSDTPVDKLEDLEDPKDDTPIPDTKVEDNAPVKADAADSVSDVKSETATKDEPKIELDLDDTATEDTPAEV